MRHALVYYYWSETPCNIWQDKANPIVLSIASFRSFDLDTKIYVIDVSKHNVWWDYIDLRLDFQIIKREPLLRKLLKKLPHEFDIKYCLEHLSRPSAIYDFVVAIPEEVIVCSDSDVFWINSPFPLEGNYHEKFCVSHNNGLCYFETRAPMVNKAFHLWTSMCSHACTSGHFGHIVTSANHNKNLTDKSVLQFARTNYPELFCKTSFYEDYKVWALADKYADPTKARNIHVGKGGLHFGDSQKALAGLYIREIRDRLMITLGGDIMTRYLDDLNIEPYSMFDGERMKWLHKG